MAPFEINAMVCRTRTNNIIRCDPVAGKRKSRCLNIDNIAMNCDLSGYFKPDPNEYPMDTLRSLEDVTAC